MAFANNPGASIHYIVGAGADDMIEYIYIGYIRLSYQDILGNVAAEVE